MKRPIVQQLPAGMMNSEIEVFTFGKTQFFFTNGQRGALSEAPEYVKEPIRKHMQQRPMAMHALRKKGILDPEEQLLVYARCVCGGFQGTADIIDGKLVGTEYWDCGDRGRCDIEGDLCCSKLINGKIITSREIELCRWIASGLPDKLIADKMKISENTINPMKRSIGPKIGGTTKVDVTRFFLKNNFEVYDNC